MNPHPSFLALDMHALGASDSATAAHVQSCARCQAHCSRLQPPPFPEWARQLDQQKRSFRSWSRVWQLAALCAAAVVVAAILPKSLRRPEPGVKGSPSVAVYMKRGAAVRLWDGEEPVLPGDRLQFKVAPAGFSRVTVVSLEADKTVELYAGEVAALGETMLPRSWTIDGESGPELILIVFSSSPLSPDQVQSAVNDLPHTERIWSMRLRLVKKAGRP
jgi:hypothetical protein